MKTISTHLITNNNELNLSRTIRKPYENYNYNQAAGDINGNATIAQVEHERDACEEELYRLRYGIENLLGNNEHGDFKEQQQQQRFRNVPNSFRTMMNQRTNSNNKKNGSWLDRCCSACCRRRWRRNKSNNTFQSSRQTPRHSDSVVSTSPSPSSTSSHYNDPNTNHTKSSLRQSISNLINPNKTNTSNLLISKDINDPAYNSVVAKMLEAKALDCLCSGYSKKNIEKQITKELSKLNQRVDEPQWNSASTTSSPMINGSSSVSSVSSDDKPFYPSSKIPQQILSPSPSAKSSNVDNMTPTVISPTNSTQKIKSSLKLNDKDKSPKKNSKVTIARSKTPKSNKSKTTKKPSSKQRKKSTSKSKTRSKPKVSSKSRSPSKSKKKNTSKSPSRKQSNSKLKPKSSGSTRKKKTKSKSNNQMNDYSAILLPTFIYPQTYQEVYPDRQRSFKV
ncbi:unnamed protein product [Adineta steineri]|uniref:Uncharacterized protein n=1 Tax=Adineta steineri TaxID=433720 RepID=A0A818U0U1_9BILA|nr:unnamed protein product [Adineta steineri]CAF3689528.1 unnamed protein product [Adineta steineri]